MYTKNALSFLLTLLFLGCSIPSGQTTPQKAQSDESLSLQKNYYYALIEKNEGVWKVIDIKNSPIEQREKNNQEILKISSDYKEVEPAYTKTLPTDELGRFECKKPINYKEYSACSSLLASTHQNFATLFQSSDTAASDLKSVDKELIHKIVEKSGLFKAIDAKKSIFAFEACQNRFREAKTSDDFSAIIEECSSLKEAEQLLALAIKNRDALKIQEEQKRAHDEQMAKTYELRMQKMIKDAEVENIRLAKIEQKSIDTVTNSIKAFRKTLQKGSQTNCGPVIEMNESSVQVLFPVKGYGDKHWISRDKIYPKGNGCRFVKGKYLAPPAF